MAERENDSSPVEVRGEGEEESDDVDDLEIQRMRSVDGFSRQSVSPQTLWLHYTTTLIRRDECTDLE